MVVKKIIILCLIVVFLTSSFLIGKKFYKSYVENSKMPFKRSMNIGNALDAPKDIYWGVTMKPEYFHIIKKAGFDSVRLPVRFSDYAKNSPNYTLDENFMKEVDYYINCALKEKLVVILDFHHFMEIMEEPERYEECFLKVWSQLAERYRDYPPELVFELLNEPNNKLQGQLWNDYVAQGVKTIRKTDKHRKIIVGPDNYYSVDRLDKLSIPKDKNIIVSFHFYEPNEFAFQGDQYQEKFKNFKNVKWIGTKEEIKAMKIKFDRAESWSRKNNVPIFVGEFGVNQNTPETSREAWSAEVRKQAEDHDFSWGYWEFCSSFGIYDDSSGKWNENMLESLIPHKAHSNK